MPICTRDGLDKKLKIPEKFHDNEEVFFCETTNEIFRDYDDYFQRVMLINSTIWSCSVTGRENLTYAEALKSEKRARKKLASFKDILKAPALIAVERSQQQSFSDLVLLTYHFLKDRYFLGELIDVCKSKHYVECKIIEIVPPSIIPDNGIIDPQTVKYKVQQIKTGNESWITQGNLLRRHRSNFTRDNLKLFLKESITTVNGVFRPKNDVFQKVVIDNKITYETLFIGKLPDWKPGKKLPPGRKPNRPNEKTYKKSKDIKPNKEHKIKDSKDKYKEKNKKQTSMAKYLEKKNGENTETETKLNMEKMKAFKEEMERRRKEKEAHQIEIEQRRIERLAKLDEELVKVMSKSDDLEREDQKPFPIFKQVKCLIPTSYFGDFLLIQEFLHSFSPILSSYDVFRTNVNIHQMCRAFAAREVAGPLSDIIQVLLSTIFSLQIEEEEECSVEYAKGKLSANAEPFITINNATATQLFIRKYFSHKLYELPIDAQTLSEILRLHFLSSGAKTDDKSERWRFQYRNGYSVTGDPGLLLRLQEPHIIRSLQMYSIYQLPFTDIIKILNCLIEQILTYYGTITLIEERLEAQSKTRFQMRTLNSAENKRSMNVINSKKKWAGEFHLQSAECKGDVIKTKELEEEMNKKIADITEQSRDEKSKYEIEFERLQGCLFDFMVYLGTDRAYRKYFIFESICGLFIEHPVECFDVCLKNPPKNCMELANCARNKRDIRIFLSKRLTLSNKENERKSIKELKFKETIEVNENNGLGKKMNRSGASLTNNDEDNAKTKDPTQYELYMCTGDPTNCIVHDKNNTDRVRWSYINTEEELNALINSLNVAGIRESALKEQFINLKSLIVEHIKKCPSALLTLESDSKYDEYIKLMMNDTQKRYQNSNYGFPENTDLNEVLHSCLLDRILQFEMDITTGDLGKLKVKDLQKWRDDLRNGTYDSQNKELSYGIPDDSQYNDPGKHLGYELQINLEDNRDKLGSLNDALQISTNVKQLSSALLQIEQAIEQKFLKEPFGLKYEPKDKKDVENKLSVGKLKLKYWETSLMNSTNYSQVFLLLNILSDSVKWFKSTNESRCLVCRRKGDPEKMLLCDECNAGTHMFCLKPKLKQIPEGNWYCKRCEEKMGITQIKTKGKSKKKLFAFDEEVEDGKKEETEEEETDDEEWTMSNNKKKPKKRKLKKKLYMLNEELFDEEDEDEVMDEDVVVEDESEEDGSEHVSEFEEDDISDEIEQDDDSDEDGVEESDVESKVSSSNSNKKDIKFGEQICKVCSFNESDIQCNVCTAWFHLECTSLRRIPRGNWLCSKCKVLEDRKRKADDKYESSDDSFEPRAKRSRRVINTRLNDDVYRTNNNSRRARRIGDDLPLNSVILYDLLNDIMKHEDAWPFLRPVALSEVPDYYEIIKKPMDFGRIKSNLNMGHYTTNEELIQDIQLVFRNCDTYNTEGNDVYSAGASLERFVVQRCEQFNLSFEPSDMNINNDATVAPI